MHHTNLPKKNRIIISDIIRSRRKTLSLEISQDARLIVRAPKKTPLSYIERLVLQKQLWILKKQSITLNRAKKYSAKKFVDGEDFLYLGGTYKLSIGELTHLPILFDRGFILSKQRLSNAKNIFTGWYKERAHEKIHERLALYSHATGLKYAKFAISGAKKRWGSCSIKGNLRFTWRLIMAPIKVIDYVVVHELAHVAVKNHSRDFWTKVRTIMPDYKPARDWLKHNGCLLRL